VYTAEGPFFDELTVGAQFDSAPGVTLTDGLAAAHQAIVGERLRFALDRPLACRVAGGPLAPPALVWNLAIGQSTVATHHVKANLFYRGLAFHRAPFLGDTMRTMTEVVGLRQNAQRPGRRPTGLAALQMTTVDQHDRLVLQFHRCAMLPLREPIETGATDDLDGIGRPPSTELMARSLADWDLTDVAPCQARPGDSWIISGGDVVVSAPELASLTLNIAQVHHDFRAAGGRRLVYGGHTIAMAMTQTLRAIPEILTVVGWHSCDHTGPVHEGDTLVSTLEFESEVDLGQLRLASLCCRVSALDESGAPARDVLTWRFVAVLPN
jgi:acyl dehydratase